VPFKIYMMDKPPGGQSRVTFIKIAESA